jgi:hypothetical protein
VTKAPLTKFVYNNNVYNIINISFFFAMYNFYFNILSSVKDDRLKNEVLIIRKKVKEFENENKKIKRTMTVYRQIPEKIIRQKIYFHTLLYKGLSDIYINILTLATL